MTVAATPSPTSASLALATPTAATSGTAGVAPVPPGPTGPAGASLPATTGVAPAFSALLLGLRAAAATPGDTPANAAADPELAVGTTALAGLWPMQAPGPVDASAPSTDAPDDKLPGDALPEAGNDLPPVDVEALLASLAAPSAFAAGPMPPPAAGASPPAGPDPAAGTIITAGESVPKALPASPNPQNATPADAASAAAGTSADTADQARWPGAPDEPLPDTVKSAADPALPDGGASAAREHGMELALPAEFRARLDSLLNATQRPVFAADPGTLTLNGVTMHGASALTATTTSRPVTDSFDSLPILQPMANPDAWTQGLGDRLLLMAEKGLQSATIRLQPEQLGPMEIRIRVDEDGTAQVLFNAHHAQTREALETAIPRLRDMFADQGLSLMQADVDSGRGSFAQRGFAASEASWDRWATEESEVLVPKDVSVWRLGRGTERRLDVLV